MTERDLPEKVAVASGGRVYHRPEYRGDDLSALCGEQAQHFSRWSLEAVDDRLGACTLCFPTHPDRWREDTDRENQSTFDDPAAVRRELERMDPDELPP